jgi:polyisoprenoid-binding protein YceI
MKTSLIVFSLLIAITGYANNPAKEKDNITKYLIVSQADGTMYKLSGTQNLINWIGTKPGGKHNGTLNISEGKISVSGNLVTSGSFTFDMNSIIDLDLDNPQMNERLIKHLKSSDFFDAEKFPLANFNIVSVKLLKSTSAAKEGEVIPNSEVTGNLTIKGITKSITFPARIIIEKNVVSVSTNPFSINRTWWGVNYQSKSIFAELKDKFIHDEIILNFNLKFNKI